MPYGPCVTYPIDVPGAEVMWGTQVSPIGWNSNGLSHLFWNKSLDGNFRVGGLGIESTKNKRGGGFRYFSILSPSWGRFPF